MNKLLIQISVSIDFELLVGDTLPKNPMLLMPSVFGMKGIFQSNFAESRATLPNSEELFLIHLKDSCNY